MLIFVLKFKILLYSHVSEDPMSPVHSGCYLCLSAMYWVEVMDSILFWQHGHELVVEKLSPRV